MRERLSRLWPVLLLLAALGLAWAMGWHRALSFEALAERQEGLRAAAEARPLLAPLAYLALYVAVVGLSLPGAGVMSLAGGWLFGTLTGASLAVLGATLGAVLIFLAARRALGGRWEGRAGALLERVRPGLERDGFSYLLALRLMPLFPFWLINLAPALAGMRLRPFVAATALGIVPGTLVLASVGAGLGEVLAEGRRPDLGVLLRPAVLLPLLALAALSLLPVAWRRWKGRDGG